MRFVCIMFFFISATVLARPVSYPGGWTLMQMNQYDLQKVHLHYSPSAKWSLGYKGELVKGSHIQFHGLQHNLLLKRWNNKHSQGNFYLQSAIGLTFSDEVKRQVDWGGFSGVAIDWENRRWFVSYASRFVKYNSVIEKIEHSGRIGFAPYLGDYGDLHTWLMVQADYQTKHSTINDHSITILPLVRFFKRVYLIEVGSNFNQHFLFNLILRF